MEVDEIRRGLPPFANNSWHGGVHSIDGTATTAFAAEDVSDILYYGDSGDDWDGHAAVVLRLKDGRLVAWDMWWGPTGDGFHEDAYGGDAEVYFGTDLNRLVLTALTDAGRELCGIPREGLS